MFPDFWRTSGIFETDYASMAIGLGELLIIGVVLLLMLGVTIGIVLAVIVATRKKP